MVPAEGGCSVISEGRSAARAAVPGAGARVPEAGARALSAEYCNLAGEALDTLQKCRAFREWNNVHEHRLGCDLGDAVRTPCRGVQVALGLADENVV
jgi:hypothetical protein